METFCSVLFTYHFVVCFKSTSVSRAKTNSSSWLSVPVNRQDRSIGRPLKSKPLHSCWGILNQSGTSSSSASDWPNQRLFVIITGGFQRCCKLFFSEISEMGIMRNHTCLCDNSWLWKRRKKSQGSGPFLPVRNSLKHCTLRFSEMS